VLVMLPRLGKQEMLVEFWKRTTENLEGDGKVILKCILKIRCENGNTFIICDCFTRPLVCVVYSDVQYDD
jgi:hypothetical protein